MMKQLWRERQPEDLDAGKSQGKTELFELLRQDHQEFKELFKQIEKSGHSQVKLRQELFSQLEGALLLHMEAEERFFYTALEQQDESRPLALESFEEHLVARTLIGSFNSLAVDDERWPAKMKVLGRLMRQHAEQEEHEMFKLAKKVLNNDQFKAIVAKVQELKYDPKKA